MSMSGPGDGQIAIEVPSMLRHYSGGASRLHLDALPTVGATLGILERSHLLLHRAICDETGAVRRHVNVFVNSSNIRDLEGLDTPVEPGDVVTIMPAVSGG
jgi:molybdopterin synthase sulfur carrier subunit